MPGEYVRVAISQGLPKWMDAGSLTVEKRLAPSWPMLKLARLDYDAAMRARLMRLDCKALVKSLPAKCVLLCWEAPNVWCHRRMVAEWIETETGLVVPEYGLERADSLRYDELPDKESKPSARRAPKPGRTSQRQVDLEKLLKASLRQGKLF